MKTAPAIFVYLEMDQETINIAYIDLLSCNYLSKY